MKQKRELDSNVIEHPLVKIEKPEPGGNPINKILS